ncbi:hypothetical protein KL86DES1_10435 [uncultured Desulfovibrio sp.]|uniref:Uncharacterized protein n=1 Tax=uncultured Desulfovibrio sp. TaxID=167968 RepID=A0A212KYV0_9BACT|nr:hypothetical protein KL86DES1_10435 [uncultured Desulfovibrio sp.]VZH32309.1 conserved protein of unknown function [Desulfovibrio sp. 86]
MKKIQPATHWESPTYKWYTQWGKVTNNLLEQYNQAGLTPVAYQSFLFQHQPGLEENYFNSAVLLIISLRVIDTRDLLTNTCLIYILLKCIEIVARPIKSLPSRIADLPECLFWDSGRPLCAKLV